MYKYINTYIYVYLYVHIDIYKYNVSPVRMTTAGCDGAGCDAFAPQWINFRVLRDRIRTAEGFTFNCYEDLGQLGQDEPASGWRWSHRSAPLFYIRQMSPEYVIGTQWLWALLRAGKLTLNDNVVARSMGPPPMYDIHMKRERFLPEERFPAFRRTEETNVWDIQYMYIPYMQHMYGIYSKCISMYNVCNTCVEYTIYALEPEGVGSIHTASMVFFVYSSILDDTYSGSIPD